jgi:hypothetical protein
MEESFTEWQYSGIGATVHKTLAFVRQIHQQTSI